MKGWENIEENFNASCSGIKRDIAALKMKLKNIKAQSKQRVKMEEGSIVERLDEAECDGDMNDSSPKEVK